PKVDAALNLHELTSERGIPLTLFSSIAGTFGGMGQGNYSAANAFLDAFAAHCRMQGHPVQSMAWGLWEQRSEMTGKLGGADLSRLARGGIVPFSSADGAALFESARTSGLPVVLPMRLDLAALAAQPTESVPALLRGLVRPAGRRPVRRAAAGGVVPARGVNQHLGTMPKAEHGRYLLDLVRSTVAGVLGYTGPSDVEEDRGLLDLGFDSLTAVELRNQLGKATELRLPVTLLFDYPTSKAIAGYLEEQMAPEAADTVEDVFPELDRLEEDFSRIAADDAARARVTARLEGILARLGPSTSATGDAAVSRIDSASDDEIFDFIENELGLN
ncbi:beta-ketoacyl reductase, partial [Streptomyces sodiiphilus]|uniref:beta-ketoacyl reductase n=1 Tax=Streptomyces sodiiphilus TaxID=226217 RepID=UPI0031D6FBA0